MLFQWSKDFQLWLFIVLSLQLFRLLLVGVFHEQAVSFSLVDLAAVQLQGLRFDVSTAVTWILPTFLLGLSTGFLDTGRFIVSLRRVLATIYIIAAIVIFGADLVFFDEYGDQFNQHIFGLVHDDTRAILVTIWKSYHPLLFAALTAFLIFSGLRLSRRWLDLHPRGAARLAAIQGIPGRVSVALGFFVLMAAAARGGSLWGEPIRLKHAFVAQDLFLNRSVINPFTALRYAVNQKLEAERKGGTATFWPSGDWGNALSLISGSKITDNIDEALKTRALGVAGVPPKHIFVVLMESHSGWTLLPEYRHVGLSPRLAALADKGLYFPRFLPSSAGTIGSLNALLTGLPETGLNINYELNSRNPYPTGMADTFRKLGYKTRFFYGGFLGWQRLDSFAQSQGFDEIHGAGHMRAGVDTNEWGVKDEYLFDYVLETVDDSEPSFNFILTTSNHPPYDLDLDALGFTVKSLPEPLRATKAETMKVLGHLWYTDQQAGAFVEAAEGKLTRPLFALTGDHTSRLQIRFPGDSVFEQVTVPFILYGPEVLKGVQADTRKAGSHLDVPATLIELTAPSGFEYYTFGQNLLHKASPGFGLGYQFIVGEGFIATDSEQPTVYALPGEPSGSITPAELADVQKRFNALRALAWHRVRVGPQLP